MVPQARAYLASWLIQRCHQTHKSSFLTRQLVDVFLFLLNYVTLFRLPGPLQGDRGRDRVGVRFAGAVCGAAEKAAGGTGAWRTRLQSALRQGASRLEHRPATEYHSSATVLHRGPQGERSCFIPTGTVTGMQARFLLFIIILILIRLVNSLF